MKTRKIGTLWFWVLLILSAEFVLADDFGNLPLQQQYVKALEPWIPAAMTEIHFLADDMATYGLAQSGHWYMQAHDTAFTAFAVLGTDPNTDEKRAGATKEELRKIALAMLRYTLRSHRAGGGACTDGQPWGHSWISSLGLERLSIGVEALKPFLDEELQKLYAKVCASEADFQCTQPLRAGLTHGNRPESNMWNGSVCIRAAVLNPESPNVPKWREKAICLFLNALSRPSDEKNTDIVDGKPVSARYVAANVFEEGGCNHHGYQNIGYMYITESNMVMLHFWAKCEGITPPDALYHNALKQWKIMKACTFNDGRLARVGGDSRVRYCYCQDYAILVWLMARDPFGDADTEAFERGWLKQVRTEQAANAASGWFMAERLDTLRQLSPLYFLRLEGDKACTLAHGAFIRRVFDIDAKPKTKVDAPTQWHDDYHGTWLQRGVNRFASWTWMGAMRPTGLCVPSDGSDLAEWQYNLSTQIFGVGMSNHNKPVQWLGHFFDGGFATCGICDALSTGGLAEGDNHPKIAKVYLAYVALPDDQTVVVLQKAEIQNDVYLRRVRGLALSVPNDVFNHFQRTFTTAAGTQTVRAIPEKFTVLENAGNWLSVDGKLGVVSIYGGTPKVARLAERQIPLVIAGQAPKPGGGYLYCEEISQEIVEKTRYYARGTNAVDCAAVILTADAESTKTLASDGVQNLSPENPALRAVTVRAANGHTYGIVVNFSAADVSFDANVLFGETAKPLTDTPAATVPAVIVPAAIAPNDVRVFEVK